VILLKTAAQPIDRSTRAGVGKSLRRQGDGLGLRRRDRLRSRHGLRRSRGRLRQSFRRIGEIGGQFAGAFRRQGRQGGAVDQRPWIGGGAFQRDFVIQSLGAMIGPVVNVPDISESGAAIDGEGGNIAARQIAGAGGIGQRHVVLVCSGDGPPSICVTDRAAGRGLRPEGRIEAVASESIEADRGALFSAQPDKAARARAEPKAGPKPQVIRLVVAI